MGKITVDCQSIREFGKKIKEESNQLVDILELMKKDSLTYEKMIDSNAGNLYKEVMLRELEKEKEIIKKNSEEWLKELTWIADTYNEMIEEIKESIGK